MGQSGSHDSVRRSYDAVAEKYAAQFGDELAGKPLDRALLACLIEQARPGAPVADVGCGPGHVAAWLADHGVPAVGIDLSPAMVAAGRRDHPAAEFREGDFLDLPAADGEFEAVVALYSIIHLEPGEFPRAFAEIRRVLRPSGLALVSFHVGSEVRHLAEWWSVAVDVDFRFLEMADVAGGLRRAGFDVQAQLERRSYPGEVETRRGYVLARRRGAGPATAGLAWCSATDPMASQAPEDDRHHAEDGRALADAARHSIAAAEATTPATTRRSAMRPSIADGPVAAR